MDEVEIDISKLTGPVSCREAGDIISYLHLKDGEIELSPGEKMLITTVYIYARGVEKNGVSRGHELVCLVFKDGCVSATPDTILSYEKSPGGPDDGVRINIDHLPNLDGFKYVTRIRIVE